MNEFGVFIGRFQPFHNAHLATVRFALKQTKQLIIVIGSSNQAQDIKDPWTELHRERMIRSCLTDDEQLRVRFVHAEDYYYNDLLWVTAVQRDINEITGGSRDVKLVGHKKDASSFYLKMFPQWGEYLETDVHMDIDATHVRKMLFEKDLTSLKKQNVVPTSVHAFLVEWMETPEFDRLHDEYQKVLSDKAEWVGAPYQPIFVTTDAVVICSGHVLVVRRRGKYGRGLVALPGGYVDAEQRLIDSCIRELKEETGLKIDRAELKKLMCDQAVFDHPRRDLRGRVLTHAYCFKLPDGDLPKVKGMDDADKAWWMQLKVPLAWTAKTAVQSLSLASSMKVGRMMPALQIRMAWWMQLNHADTNKNKFFSDHYHILKRFVNKY